MRSPKRFSHSSFFRFKVNLIMLNSPLREEPREQRAVVIRSTNEFVLLEWLRSSGRLIERETQESEHLNQVDEISEMIEVDDVTYGLDDDETDSDLDD